MIRFSIRFAAIMAVVAAGLCALRPATAQNLLTNGSFEGNSSSTSQAVGSTTIPGWTVTTAEIAWVRSGDFSPAMIASDGTGCLDLTGYHDSAPYGGVTQSIATTIGATYRLSFDLGSTFIGNNVSALASAGSTSQTFFFTHSTTSSDQEWQRYTLDFVASATTTPITMTGTSTVVGSVIGLDNTSVVLVSGAVVPEANTAALIGLTLPMIGMVAVIRQRKK